MPKAAIASNPRFIYELCITNDLHDHHNNPTIIQ